MRLPRNARTGQLTFSRSEQVLALFCASSLEFVLLGAFTKTPHDCRKLCGRDSSGVSCTTVQILSSPDGMGLSIPAVAVDAVHVVRSGVFETGIFVMFPKIICVLEWLQCQRYQRPATEGYH